MTLGEKIRELRKRQGLTQEKAAKNCGLTRSYFSLIEIGQIRHPSAKMLIGLAAALCVDPDVLFQAGGYIPGEREDTDLADPTVQLYVQLKGRMTEEDKEIIRSVIATIGRRRNGGLQPKGGHGVHSQV